jgi:hypothetical protein
MLYKERREASQPSVFGKALLVPDRFGVRKHRNKLFGMKSNVNLAVTTCIRTEAGIELAAK